MALHEKTVHQGGFFVEPDRVETSTRQGGEGETCQGGMSQGNVPMATCCQSRTFGVAGGDQVPPGPPKVPKQIPVGSNNSTPVLLPLICICYLVLVSVGLCYTYIMSTIKHYIANSTNKLDNLKDLITKSLESVIPIVEKDLNANQIDIIFISAPGLVIPEYGIGGSSPGPNHINVSFDPKSNKITQKGLDETLFHEIHHCMRWRNPGYGETLGEAMISEGLACLYEEQKTGNVPIYAQVSLDDKQIELANKIANSKTYSHSNWFFGSGDIVRWFGYTYGYDACKNYSIKTSKTAAELVNVSAKDILDAYNEMFVS